MMNTGLTKQKWEELLANGWRKDEKYVFVSYASADWEKVYPTVLALRARGINVYIDSEFSLNQSQNWLENFQTILIKDYNCAGIIAFLSIDYMRSYACLMEQLANQSKQLRNTVGRFHPMFFISLEKELNSVQNMRDYIYSYKIRAESSNMEVKIATEEHPYLKKFMIDSIIENKMSTDQSPEAMASDMLRGLRDKHDVVVAMFQLVFEHRLPSFSDFRGSEECADLLYINFVGEKNQDICMNPVEELKADTLQKLSKAKYSLEGGPGPVPEDAPDTQRQKDPGSGTASAKSGDSQKEPGGKEDRKPEDEAVPDAGNGRLEKEDPGERKQKQYTATGDITFTLYGREYTYNQSDMMLTFFAQVLNRHQECVEGLPDRGGMNCASAVDYTKKENRTEEMPSYFRVCQYFEFDSGCGVCIGTAFGVNDKLKKMAMLLDICGEDPSVFSSEQVELPEVGSGKGRNAAIMTYRVYGKSFSSSQTEMMGNIFREVIERHPDKLQKLADQLMCVAVFDYSAVPKKERPVYFASLCVYELKGTPYSIGGTFGMAEKLRQIAKLLDICEVDKSEVEIEGYELPEAGKRKKTNIRYF